MSDSRNGMSWERFRTLWQVFAWLIGTVVAVLVTYNATANASNARLAVLESQQRTTEQRLADINGQLSTLNSKMDQILLGLVGDRRQGR